VYSSCCTFSCKSDIQILLSVGSNFVLLKFVVSRTATFIVHTGSCRVTYASIG